MESWTEKKHGRRGPIDLKCLKGYPVTYKGAQDLSQGKMREQSRRESISDPRINCCWSTMHCAYLQWPGFGFKHAPVFSRGNCLRKQNT